MQSQIPTRKKSFQNLTGRHVYKVFSLLEDNEIEPVVPFEHLGHKIRIGRQTQTGKLERSIDLSCPAYENSRHIFRSDLQFYLNTKRITKVSSHKVEKD